MSTETLKLGKNPKRLDPEIVEHGETMEPPMAPGVEFTILPWATYNPRFRRALEKRSIEVNMRENGASGEAPDPIEEGIDIATDPEFIVDAVLADINGLLNGDDNKIKYTRARGVQLLSDPGWSHLRDWTVRKSFELANRYDRGVEADAGN